MNEERSSGAAKPPPRISRAGRWRALVLVLVHVVVAIHIAHWMSTGKSMSPLEPSEGMEFSKHSVVNAGLVFFGLTILSTLVLGRWFCGWACHLVALQDLCRWLLMKVGIRPRAVRSRLLAFVPLFAATYMFLYPLAYRLWRGAEPVPVSWELQKTDFWETFPPLGVALLTFAVCGFVIVYFLGSKGFCTYACPYGAFYGLADKLAPGRIRVTDACAGCGHCTATCSSNVIVHAEVRDYGMVVDPGCMKCLDCVSVCPTHALYFGFGRPSLGARPRREARSARRHDFTWVEELGLAALFVLFLLVFRGLYGIVPFLLSLAIAGILAYLFLTFSRLAYRSNLSLGRSRLKSAGRWTPAGIGFLLVMLPVAGSVVHAGLVQHHSRRSSAAMEELQGLREPALALDGLPLDEPDSERVEIAFEHATFVERFGWLTTLENQVELAWLALLRGDAPEFEERMLAAVAHDRAGPGLRLNLVRFYQARGRIDDAIVQTEAYLAEAPDPAEFDRYARMLVSAGRGEGAFEVYQRAIESHPDNAELHYNLGVAAAMQQQIEPALAAFRRAVELDPERIEARENLAGLLCGAGRLREGIEAYHAILERRPRDAESLRSLVQAYAGLGDLGGAREDLRSRLVSDPENEAARSLLDALEGR